QVPLALLDHVRRRAQQRDAPGPAQVAPRRESGAGGRHGLIDQRRVRLRELAETNVAVDRAGRVVDEALAAVAAVDQRRPEPAEQPGLGLRDDLVEMRMDPGEVLAGV